MRLTMGRYIKLAKEKNRDIEPFPDGSKTITHYQQGSINISEICFLH
jgi:hypothetical protein